MTVAVERVALSYRGMHTKVQREKGAAVEHRCVDCSKCAAEWSYIADYVPRCRRCHRRYDQREVAARRNAEALVSAGQLVLNGLARIAVTVAA